MWLKRGTSSLWSIPSWPDVSPEGVVGKMTVLLMISTRARGVGGIWECSSGLLGSLLTGTTGVAAWGGRAVRVASAGAADTSRARSWRIWTLINWTEDTINTCHVLTIPDYFLDRLSLLCDLDDLYLNICKIPFVECHTEHKSVHSMAVGQTLSQVKGSDWSKSGGGTFEQENPWNIKITYPWSNRLWLPHYLALLM